MWNYSSQCLIHLKCLNVKAEQPNKAQQFLYQCQRPKIRMTAVQVFSSFLTKLASKQKFQV